MTFQMLLGILLLIISLNAGVVVVCVDRILYEKLIKRLYENVED